MAEPTALTRLVIRPWPKMILLWPTAVISLFMALAQQFLPNQENVWGGVFLVTLAINLFVLTFEFPRGTSLTFALASVAVILLLLLLNHTFNVISPLKYFFAVRDVHASAEFYWGFFALFLILFVGMVGTTRLEYWELTPNELIRHHGFLGDVERYSTAGLKMNKEITDIFEYVLSGSGRMVLVIPNVPRPVVLDNVLNINRIERLSEEILGARVVRIEQTPPNMTEEPLHPEKLADG